MSPGRFRDPNHDFSPLCIRKEKELAIWRGEIEKQYVIENNNVMRLRGERPKKTPGGENEGNLHYVIENKEHRGHSPLYP